MGSRVSCWVDRTKEKEPAPAKSPERVPPARPKTGNPQTNTNNQENMRLTNQQGRVAGRPETAASKSKSICSELIWLREPHEAERREE